jgi:hypothetical protein
MKNFYELIEEQSLNLTLAEVALNAHLLKRDDELPETLRSPYDTIPVPTSPTVPCRKQAA